MKANAQANKTNDQLWNMKKHNTVSDTTPSYVLCNVSLQNFNKLWYKLLLIFAAVWDVLKTDVMIHFIFSQLVGLLEGAKAV